MSEYAYAYFHGFLSSPGARKAEQLSRAFVAEGRELVVPALHQPDFAHWTMTQTFSALDDVHNETARARGIAPDQLRWRIVGSSLGAWIALQWATLNPGRIDSALLLCPVLDVEVMLDPRMLDSWRARGTWDFGTADAPRRLAWNFAADLRQFCTAPDPEIPLRIIHGRQDETVDIASSRQFAAVRRRVQLMEVEDTHSLESSVEDINRAACAWLTPPANSTIDPAGTTNDLTCHWDFFGPNSQPTAEHFCHHLREWLARESITGAVVATESAGPGHCAARLDAQQGDRSRIVQQLKPRRCSPAESSCAQELP